MSVFVSVGIIVLAMLTIASLQLIPSVFILFHHYALGKYSKKKASIMATFFILGTETVSACLFLSSYYLVNFFFLNHTRPEESIFVWLGIILLIILSFVSLLFYFKPEKQSTRLYIPNTFANTLAHNAKTAKNNSDAFILGALSNTCELLFTFPLYILTAIEITEMQGEYLANDLLTLLYIISPTIPLLFIKFRFTSGHNLAEIQRNRIKDKPFVKFILSISYLTTAVLLICFRVS